MLLLLLACGDTGDTGDLDDDGYGLDDCGPQDRLVFPNAQEICDRVDNDCDGQVDETFDLDADGYLADDEAACRALGQPLDCDDLDPSVHPDADEVCNGVDDDCSGHVDDAPDQDQDGFGCDDLDAARSPDADDVCDGVDNDCDGSVDDHDDHDGDGLGDCLDCDDQDAANGPHLSEVCDEQDNDCDGVVDEGFDQDEDGWSTCQGDCEDLDPSIYPGAFELCDGLDNDCDATTIEDDDTDGDGVLICEGDCDDTDIQVSPNATETCNSQDDDCDGAVDDDPSCWGCTEQSGYLFCTSKQSWAVAGEVCQSLGRMLVTLDDAQENELVRATATALVGAHVWVGLNDHESEGVWVWTDGDALGFTAWHSGEPNDYGAGEDCGQLYVNYGTWNDASCGSGLGFVCE